MSKLTVRMGKRQQYLVIKLHNGAFLNIKQDDEGVVVDLWAKPDEHGELQAEPVATTYALYTELNGESE